MQVGNMGCGFFGVREVWFQEVCGVRGAVGKCHVRGRLQCV